MTLPFCLTVTALGVPKVALKDCVTWKSRCQGPTAVPSKALSSS